MPLNHSLPFLTQSLSPTWPRFTLHAPSSAPLPSFLNCPCLPFQSKSLNKRMANSTIPSRPPPAHCQNLSSSQECNPIFESSSLSMVETHQHFLSRNRKMQAWVGVIKEMDFPSQNNSISLPQTNYPTQAQTSCYFGAVLSQLAAP